LPTVNYLAVLLAAVTAMVIGFAWYSKVLFGAVWMKEVGLTDAKIKENSKNNGYMYGLMTLSALVMAYVLAMVISLTNMTGLYGGVQAAFWVWLGFTATYALSMVIFEGRSWSWFGISAGYYLVSLLVMSVVLGMM
jgi:hypothetical protein